MSPQRKQCLTLLVVLGFASSHLVYSQSVRFPGDDWEVVAPEDAGYDSELLNAAIQKVPNSNRTMVIHNGRVIWRGSQVDTRHSVFSITKSFASTGLGLLIDDGVLSVDTPVADFVPSLATDYGDVTFEHLAKQSGNLQGSVLNPEGPLFTGSGSQFVYNWEPNNNVLSHGIGVAAGKPLEDFIAERISTPIGLETGAFDFNDIVQRSGSDVVEFNQAESGLRATASDLGRYGLLFMTGGVWNGERILSQEWIDTATSVQVTGVPNHPNSIGNFVNNFGYGWWRYSPNFFNAFGFGANRVSVSPELGLVIVSLGSAPNNNFGPSDDMIAAIVASEIPFVWDGLGDGVWHGEAGGNARWLYRGNPAVETPTGNIRISSDHVTATDDVAVSRIGLQGTAHLEIGTEGSLSASTVEITDMGRLTLSGASSIDSLAASDEATFTVQGPQTLGNVTLANTSVMEVVNGEGSIDVAGNLHLNRTTLAILADEKPWNSTMIVRGTPDIRRGNLEFNISPASDATKLTGTTLKLFEWTQEPRPFRDVLLHSRLEVDLTNLYTTGELSIVSVLGAPSTAGDFDANDLLDAADIDELNARIRVGSPDNYYDVEGDGIVDENDLSAWLTAEETRRGDVNLDGTVSFPDFLVLSEHFGGSGGWAQGDFDGSGVIEFPDFLILAENFETAQTTGAVPEPNAFCALLAGLVAGSLARRRR